MYKYVWIIMLVSLAVCFIGYTAVCLYKSLMYIIEYYNDVKKDVSIFTIINDTWGHFSCRHDILYILWISIIIVAVIALFVSSLVCYLPLSPAE